jgi:hypothetical protein
MHVRMSALCQKRTKCAAANFIFTRSMPALLTSEIGAALQVYGMRLATASFD